MLKKSVKIFLVTLAVLVITFVMISLVIDESFKNSEFTQTIRWIHTLSMLGIVALIPLTIGTPLDKKNQMGFTI